MRLRPSPSPTPSGDRHQRRGPVRGHAEVHQRAYGRLYNEGTTTPIIAGTDAVTIQADLNYDPELERGETDATKYLYIEVYKKNMDSTNGETAGEEAAGGETTGEETKGKDRVKGKIHVLMIDPAIPDEPKGYEGTRS